MPKMKTHKGSAKRFKITGSGKVKAKKKWTEAHPYLKIY